MSVETSVMRIKMGLAAALESGSPAAISECRVLLSELRALAMSQDVLKATKIGFFLNKMRKTYEKQHSALSASFKALVKVWQKQFVPVSKNAQALARAKAPRAKQMPAAREPVDTKGQDPSPASPAPSSSSSFSSSSNATSSSSSNNPPASPASRVTLGRTGDSFRNKAQNMMYSVLGPSPDGDDARRVLLAYTIEACMYSHARENSASDLYKEKYRALAFNLKDVKNAELNKSIFDNRMTPYDLVETPSKDLGNKELRDMRNKERKDAIEAARQDWGRDKVSSGSIWGRACLSISSCCCVACW
jgi:hypothetical protein